MSPGIRVIRGALAVTVLIALLLVVNGWWREYRRDDSAPPPPPASTETPDAAPAEEGAAPPPPAEGVQAPVSGKEVVVLIEGLNFRKEPSRGGALIRGLARDTRLAHIQTADGWHHVRDADGVEGYVSASPQYTAVQE